MRWFTKKNGPTPGWVSVSGHLQINFTGGKEQCASIAAGTIDAWRHCSLATKTAPQLGSGHPAGPGPAFKRDAVGTASDVESVEIWVVPAEHICRCGKSIEYPQFWDNYQPLTLVVSNLFFHVRPLAVSGRLSQQCMSSFHLASNRTKICCSVLSFGRNLEQGIHNEWIDGWIIKNNINERTNKRMNKQTNKQTNKQIPNKHINTETIHIMHTYVFIYIYRAIFYMA